MLNNKKRGFLASAGALVTAVALALGGAASAQATTKNPVADIKLAPETSGLVITKLERGAAEPQQTKGLQNNDIANKRIGGVTFEAYRVPLTKVALTNEGQAEIAATTLAQAQSLVNAKLKQKSYTQADLRSGTTPTEGTDVGVIRWTNTSAGKTDSKLEAGLWLVRETNTPAGVVPAGDFLVAAPLTNPEDRTQWLNDIFVYPKNHTVSGTKAVQNADKLVVGQDVTWTVTIDNPSPRDTNSGQFVAADRLDITDELNEKLATDASKVKFTSPTTITKDHYTVSVGTDAKQKVDIKFNERGLQVLAAQPNTPVIFTIDTTVKEPGSIKNIVNFFTSTKQTTPQKTTEPEIKYGGFAFTKLGVEGDKKTKLAGAEFRVFANPEDAKNAVSDNSATRAAALEKALKPLGGGQEANGVWKSDKDGIVRINGLRYSEWADNATATAENKKLQEYWLVETKAPEGYQLLSQAYKFKVDADSAANVAKVTIENQKNTNGFVLPLTGGTGTLFLTIGGIALLAVVLIVARRRQHAAE